MRSIILSFSPFEVLFCRDDKFHKCENISKSSQQRLDKIISNGLEYGKIKMSTIVTEEKRGLLFVVKEKE